MRCPVNRPSLARYDLAVGHYHKAFLGTCQARGARAIKVDKITNLIPRVGSTAHVMRASSLWQSGERGVKVTDYTVR